MGHPEVNPSYGGMVQRWGGPHIRRQHEMFETWAVVECGLYIEHEVAMVIRVTCMVEDMKIS